MKKIPEFGLFIIDGVGNRLGINARYFTYQGFFTLQAHGINIVYGLVVSYATALFFSPELFGQYRFVLNIIGMLSIITLGGIATAIAKDLNQHEKSPLLHTAKMYYIPIALYAMSLLITIPIVSIWGRSELWSLLLIVAMLGPIEAAMLIFSGGIIIGKALFKKAIYYSLTAKIISIILISAMFTWYQSATLLLAITMSVNILVHGTFVKKYIYSYTNAEKNNRIFIYGTKLSLINMPNTLVWYLDGLMISAYFGITQLAVFTVALMIPEQVKILFKELIAITFSRQASGKDSTARRRQLVYFSSIGTICFLFIILLYWITADVFFGILFPKYNDANTIFLSKIAFATLITVPWNLIPQYLQAHGATKAVRNSNIIASVVFLICLITLIPSYSLLGAIISRGLFRISYATLSLYYLLTAQSFNIEK